MLTKQQAAESLGVTVRSIEAYAAKGYLTVRRGKGLRGDIALFDEGELQKLKETRAQTTFTVPAALAVKRQAPQPPAQALAQPPPFGSFAEVLSETLADPQVRGLLSDLLQTFVREGVKQWVASNTAGKLALSLKEASNLSGLSVTTLRSDIRAGDLKAKIIGRGWKIRRADLDSYMQKAWK